MGRRRHPLEGRPGYTRYLRSEQIAQEADALLDGWGPLVAPESLKKAKRFIHQYFATDDLRSFPWETDPSLLEDLELATYRNEALKMSFVSTKLNLVAIGEKFEKSDLSEIDSLPTSQEKHQKVMEVLQRDGQHINSLAQKLYVATDWWLERTKPAIELRGASMREALREEERLRSDPE